MKLSEVISSADTLRFDSDYYLKKYIANATLVINNQKSFCKFSDLDLTVDGSAFYPALEPFYNNGDYPFIRVGDVKNFVDYDNCVRVPFEILDKYPTLKHVKKGDIVLTKGGTVGLAGLITKNCCVTRDLIFINSSALEEADYTSLYLFLSSNFAYDQLIRSSSQSVQPHLTITLVRNIHVFLYSSKFKKQLNEVYNLALKKIAESKAIYSQAESLLLETLGLKNFNPTTDAVNIKTLKESFGTSGRLDAEYYQKKFDELEVRIIQTGESVKLGSLLSINKRGTQPIYVETADGIPVLNSKHIRENKIEFSDNRTGDKNETNPELIIRKNDVLINGTGVGTIGRCAVYLKDEPALPDNHVTILRAKDIDPIFLAVMLNSPLGKMQVDKYFKGSSGQIELYPNDINEFIVWKAPVPLQNQIRTLIEKAGELNNQSEKLLEVAKKAVEMAIEESEEKAMAWIAEKQLNTSNG